ARAPRCGSRAAGRGHDRRARQRHAAVGRLRGGRDPQDLRVRAGRRTAGHGIQMGFRPPDRSGRHPGSGARTRGARAKDRAGRGHLRYAGSGLRRRPGLDTAAAAAQRRRADSLPRLRRHQRRAAVARSGLMATVAEALAAVADGATRCGIDTVEIARVERLLRESAPQDLQRLFSAQELADSGEGAGRIASLAARFAAKEACVKLFPREAALGEIEPADFAVTRDAYGAPRAQVGAKALPVLARNRIRSIELSLSHDRVSASAVALALPEAAVAPPAGRIIDPLLPIRRRVMVENLRRVFGASVGATEIRRLTQEHYAHLWRLCDEFLRFRWLSDRRKAALVRVENVEALAAALGRNKGVLVLT